MGCTGGLYWWAILVGYTGGLYWWVILVGYTGGQYWWAILVGYTGPWEEHPVQGVDKKSDTMS